MRAARLYVLLLMLAVGGTAVAQFQGPSNQLLPLPAASSCELNNSGYNTDAGCYAVCYDGGGFYCVASGFEPDAGVPIGDLTPAGTQGKFLTGDAGTNYFATPVGTTQPQPTCASPDYGELWFAPDAGGGTGATFEVSGGACVNTVLKTVAWGTAGDAYTFSTASTGSTSVTCSGDSVTLDYSTGVTTAAAIASAVSSSSSCAGVVTVSSTGTGTMYSGSGCDSSSASFTGGSNGVADSVDVCGLLVSGEYGWTSVSLASGNGGLEPDAGTGVVYSNGTTFSFQNPLLISHGGTGNTALAAGVLVSDGGEVGTETAIGIANGGTGQTALPSGVLLSDGGAVGTTIFNGPFGALLSSGMVVPASTDLGGCIILNNTSTYSNKPPVATCTNNGDTQDGGPDPDFPLVLVTTSNSSGNAVINYVSSGVAMQMTWQPTLMFHIRPGTTTNTRTWVGLYGGSQNPDGYDLPQAALVGARCSSSASDTTYQLCTGNNTVSGTSCIASLAPCTTAITSDIGLSFDGTTASMYISQNGLKGPWLLTQTTTNVPSGITGGTLIFESVTTLTNAIAQTLFGNYNVWQG